MDSTMIHGILLGMAQLGVTIVKVEETPPGTVYITVPEFSEHVDVHGNELAGKLLAKRIKETFNNLGWTSVTLKYQICKGLTWTKDMAHTAEE